MKVKILKCNIDNSMWYNGKIGEEFCYVGQDSCGIWVRTRDTFNTLNWIHPSECETVVNNLK